MLAIICFFILIISVLDIGCPFLFLFKIPCPTCGVTRAILAFLRGDLKSYLRFQPMAIPLLFAVWLALHQRLFSQKRMVWSIVFSIVVFNLILYLVRILK